MFELTPIAYKTLVDEMSDGVLVVDRLDRVVGMNPAAQFALSLSAGEAIGQPVAQVLRFWLSIANALSDKAELQTEVSVGTGEAQRYYDLRISLLKGQRGQLTGRLIVLREITKRKEAEFALIESEEKLRQIASSLREAVWLRDTRTLAVLYVNPAYEEYLGTNLREPVSESHVFPGCRSSRGQRAAHGGYQKAISGYPF